MPPQARAAVLAAFLAIGLAGTAFAIEPVTPAQHEARKAQANANTIGVITGPSTGSFLRIAEDMASVLDEEGGLRVLPIAGKGSVQNITDLLYLKGVDAAIVQADVLAQIRAENLHYDISKRVEYVAPLFNEEVHLLAREGITDAAQLAGKKVNFGPEGAGANMTGKALFAALGVAPQVTQLEDGQALAALKAGEIDAMLVITAKPSPLLEEIREADNLHLIGFAYPEALSADYAPARLEPSDYPALIRDGKAVDSIAVRSVLAVFAWPRGSEREQRITRFVNRFFGNFGRLTQAPHHPKWQEVNIAGTLEGWTRNRAAEAFLKRGGPAPEPAAEVSTAPQPEPASGQFMQKFIDWQKQSSAP